MSACVQNLTDARLCANYPTMGTHSTLLDGGPSSQEDLSPPAGIDRLLARAGISVNADEPWSMHVHDASVYGRVFASGTLGLGEAYMDGLWDAERLDEFFYRAMRIAIEDDLTGWAKIRMLMASLRANLFNLQSSKRAFQVGEQHYDVGNDVFEAMLDPTMTYSCGYWQDADTLEQAQQAKLRMICEKLELTPGERLLDIGCGWGSLAEYAARNYDVEVIGITVSKEQHKLAEQRVAGLPVRIELIDYRALEGEFDKVVSVGMFEHVGPANYVTFFDTVKELMHTNGLFLLHTIGSYKTSARFDAWMEKYIFPNGKIPSATEITRAVEGRFLIEDWHNFGLDYDHTLMAWMDNFDRHWASLKNRYNERFYRMWKYYLLSCAGFFRSRQGQLWQLGLTNRHRPEGYRSVR